MAVKLVEAPTDPLLDQEPPREAHIVAREDNATADAIILEATVEGTPVTALCGATFVPSRDPKRLPPCGKCQLALQDILKMREML